MIKATARDRWDWLWQGYLGPGNVTLLTSLWESGKSTLTITITSLARAERYFLYKSHACPSQHRLPS
jgi:hypothetical protein